jgi:predicted nucleic acid-binding protein
MLKAVSNTSPLLYLYRIGSIEWLPRLFNGVWIPEAVKDELQAGRSKGYDVPNPDDYSWLKVVNPKSTPFEWLALDLGPGEIAAMALALENPDKVVLLDDLLARRTAQAAGLQVWGTLKVLLEAKSHGVITNVEPFVSKLSDSGMWVSAEIKERILKLAGES